MLLLFAGDFLFISGYFNTKLSSIANYLYLFGGSRRGCTGAMLRALSSSLLRHTCSPINRVPARHFWEYVNMMFNKPDMERIKLLGPDRACAEWVLRNGGTVTWTNGKTLDDYNMLPPEGVTKTLSEIDGSGSSISHYGFEHLIGCKDLKKIILHNNKYIEDKALKGLSHGKEALEDVQVSHCLNVTDAGVKEMIVLSKLNRLVMFGLQSVENLEDCKSVLQKGLPKCKIEIKEPSIDNVKSI